MGSPRVRAVSVAALVLVLGAVLMPYLFRLLLPLPEWLYEALLLSYLGGATLVTLVVGAVSWVALWPATPYLDLRPGEPEPQGADPREAKEALQAFPGRLALAGTAAGELLTATGWLALLGAGLPLALVLSLSLTTAVVVALLWMLLHALGQSAVEPHLLRLREVPVPLSSEAGTAVAARTGATLLLIVLSGTVPAAVFANAFVERQQDQHARDHAERCARWLSIATRGLSPLLAQRLVDTANLSQGLPTTTLEEARQSRPRSLRAAARPPATPWGRALSATEADADVPASVMSATGVSASFTGTITAPVFDP